jgi:hypothetical protein
VAAKARGGDFSLVIDLHEVSDKTLLDAEYGFFARTTLVRLEHMRDHGVMALGRGASPRQARVISAVRPGSFNGAGFQ